MADYYLKNIDENIWRRFKAVCALHGLTVRDALLSFILVQSGKGDGVQAFVEGLDKLPTKEGEGL